jgi:hypothetical protein
MVFNYFMRRLNTYPITDNDKEEEMKITEEMLESNGYDAKLLGKRKSKVKQSLYTPWRRFGGEEV